MSIFYVHFPQELICLNKTSKNQREEKRLYVFNAAPFYVSPFALTQPSHILRSTEASLLCFNIKKKRNLLIVRLIILHTDDDDDDNGDGGGGEDDDVANKIVKKTFIKFIILFATTTKCLEDNKINIDDYATHSQHSPKTENWTIKAYREQQLFSSVKIEFIGTHYLEAQFLKDSYVIINASQPGNSNLLAVSLLSTYVRESGKRYKPMSYRKVIQQKNERA
ncbi:hypothetical protein GQX74_012406 [Glossina fuscipes]|nr:hypothetical protein GQX74_012406 [Glossina fuscipes]